ncbi:hypothetical protein ACFLZK_00410 [Patescibacteria group bacterium]
MASNKDLKHINSVKGKLSKKKKHAQANRIRRKIRQKSKRVC